MTAIPASGALGGASVTVEDFQTAIEQLRDHVANEITVIDSVSYRIAIGFNSGDTGQGNHGIAIGYAAARESQGLNSVAIGRFAGAEYDPGEWFQAAYSVAIGDSSTTGTTTAGDAGWHVAVGASSIAGGIFKYYSTAVGGAANAGGDLAGAFGYSADARASRTLAVGADSGTTSETYQGWSCFGYGASVITNDDQIQIGNSDTTTYTYGAVQNRSDARDKTDVRDTELGLDFINALRPVQFRWDMREDYRKDKTQPLSAVVKDGSKKRGRFHNGLIAQEVAAVCGELGVDFAGLQHHAAGGGDDVYSIGYEELIAPLIKAVQQLSARVAELEGR